MRYTRPYTIIFSTATLDARIASSTGYSMLSCIYDFTRLYYLRGIVDAVMVGANTILIDNPTLRKRLQPQSKRYYRIIIDGKLRVKPGLRIFTEKSDSRVVIITAIDDQSRITDFKKKVPSDLVDIHIVGRNGVIDLRKAFSLLQEIYGIESILVEGGGHLNYKLIESKLVDEIRVTITPYIFGAGISFIRDPEERGFASAEEGPRLDLICFEKCPCGRCIHLVYRIAGSSKEHIPQVNIPACLSDRLVEINRYAKTPYSSKQSKYRHKNG